MIDMPTLEQAKENVVGFMTYMEKREQKEREERKPRHRGRLPRRRAEFFNISRGHVRRCQSLEELLEFLQKAWLLTDEQTAKILTVEKTTCPTSH